MNLEQILLSFNGGLIIIVGYFLVKTMTKLDTTADKADKAANDILLLKQETGFKHERLEEKLDDLRDSIVSLTNEIKTLNKHNN